LVPERERVLVTIYVLYLVASLSIKLNSGAWQVSVIEREEVKVKD
jgi:hypothetical protein